RRTALGIRDADQRAAWAFGELGHRTGLQCRYAYRGQWACPERSRRCPAACFFRMANYRCLDADRARPLRCVSPYERVSSQCDPDGPAIGTLKKSEYPKYSSKSADAGKWIYYQSGCNTQYIRYPSKFPCRIRSESAIVGSAGSSCRTANDGHILGNQRYEAAAGISAEHVSFRCNQPVRVRLSLI